MSSFEGCQRSAGAVGSYCLEMVGRESCEIVSVRTGCGVKSGAAKNRLHELSGCQALGQNHADRLVERIREIRFGKSSPALGQAAIQAAITSVK